eukprot:366400-Chlamydomonas_euryale.AAC.7
MHTQCHTTFKHVVHTLSPPCLCNCPGEPMRRASACVLAGGKPISVSHTASDSLLTIGRPNWIEIDSILVKSPAKDSTSSAVGKQRPGGGGRVGRPECQCAIGAVPNQNMLC